MENNEAVELSQSTSSGSRLPTILMILNLFATTGLIAALFMGLVPMGQPDIEEGASEVEVELAPAIYESMDKPVVANFPGKGRPRYLQLVVQFMTRSEDSVLAIRTHMPAIIDAIYVLLAKTDYESLQTLEGREVLRTNVRDISRQILEKQTGDPGIEQVFFTTYLFQ